MNSPEPEPDLIEIFARPIHEAGIKYLVGGSVGAMYYSEPRFTVDIDLPILLNNGNIEAFRALFPEDCFYLPPAEVIWQEFQRECNGHFNIIHHGSGLKADIYPSMHDPLFGWAWQHKKTQNTASGRIFVAPAEYIILWKLEYYRLGGGEKHLSDIRKMIRVSGTGFDRVWLDDRIADRHLQEGWDRVEGFK